MRQTETWSRFILPGHLAETNQLLKNNDTHFLKKRKHKVVLYFMLQVVYQTLLKLFANIKIIYSSH